MGAINKPALGATDIDDYLAHANTTYKSIPGDGLEQIYAKVWIDSFRQAWLGINLYRRTHATPCDETPPYSVNENSFYKVPYPEREKINNPENFKDALNSRTNTPEHKLFWHR
ncbi:MAG: hypothetical protein JEZ14_10720 [Marinilabiliaceae bacterium]|nr:hypothetical protein [Marinilabiliaceae bacterium]